MTTLLLPSDHIVIRVLAMQINDRNRCELCDGPNGRVLRNGAKICPICRAALKEMQERGE